MARQLRIQSMDVYSKIGCKSPKSDSISIFEEGTESFYLTKSYKSTNTTRLKKKPQKTQGNFSVCFDKQVPRPDFCTYTQDVNANRFVSFNTAPSASSNTRKISSPNFSMSQGRRRSLMYSTLEGQPSYDPKYKQVWKKLDTGLVQFNKVEGRKQKKLSCTDVYLDVSYNGVDKKVKSPVLNKSQPKPCDPVLPMYMLKNVTRGNSITDKGLEMNYYKTTNFLPLTSGFGEGWSTSKLVPGSIKGKCPKIVKILDKFLEPEN